MLEIGKAKREANLLIGKYKKEPDLSFNNKSEQPHNTRAIIAESLGMSTGKVAQAELVRADLLSINDKKLDPLKRGWQLAGGDHGNQYKKVAGLSKNDKPGNPPHNTQKIIAGNDQA